ncbi:MAG: lipopolysaccharide heptosyltransferase II [Candidatus Cloacimonetes bacterium]|jgi:heptosyltransferase-2|nr:lipopolysaccharide heptosyltransferase II [Candidatus Cloacimonadota bacterium]MDD2422646.1 lipopolysaccharide heptosyltransferase II [Candidatus Cloacimonadota bacterium]MDD4277177.1 lipopolysaccharide heptosyltransferase II [Candidatus Cloacimonadota bacterium]MDY0325428.1 lipopolysaccharide heptosyltransferase II [Candidatus Cloacimonadaceae bacterium]
MIKRILIIQTAFIGDVILITPLIRAVKKLYPRAAIDALVVPGAAGLLKNNPYLSEVLSYSKRDRALLSMGHMISLLKAKGYDMAISPHSSGRTHLLMYLARIPQRLGFDRGTMPFLLTAKTPHPRGIHKAKKNLALLGPISKQEFDPQTELFPSAEDKAKINDLLTPLYGQELIALAPGSVWATKCWPVEYYAELARTLSQRGYGILLIGGKEDKPKCDIIQQSCPNAVNLAGRTNLLESAAAIAQCQLMICNDSGALHIANAMQTRVIAFFGPTVQSLGYFPFGADDKVFETDLDCRPCSSHGPQKCPLKHHNCMKLLKPEAVLDYILEQIK